MRKKIAAVAAVALLGLAGCSSTHKSSDTPPANQIHDVVNPEVISQPYGFRNVITFCDHGNRVYETSRSETAELASTVAVVPGDPSCGAK